MENNMEQSPHRNVVKAEALVTAGNADFMQLVDWLESGAENVYLVDEAGRYLWRVARKDRHPIVYGAHGYGLSLSPLEPIVFDDPIDEAHVQALMAAGEAVFARHPEEKELPIVNSGGVVVCVARTEPEEAPWDWQAFTADEIRRFLPTGTRHIYVSSLRNQHLSSFCEAFQEAFAFLPLTAENASVVWRDREGVLLFDADIFPACRKLGIRELYRRLWQEYQAAELVKYAIVSQDWASIRKEDATDWPTLMKWFDQSYYAVHACDAEGAYVGSVTIADARAAFQSGTLPPLRDLSCPQEGSVEDRKMAWARMDPEHPEHEAVFLEDGKIVSCILPWLNGSIAGLSIHDANLHQQPHWELVSKEVAGEFLHPGSKILLSSEAGSLKGFRERFGDLFDIETFDGSQLERYRAGAFDWLLYDAILWPLLETRTYSGKALYTDLLAESMRRYWQQHHIAYYACDVALPVADILSRKTEHPGGGVEKPLTGIIWKGLRNDYFQYADDAGEKFTPVVAGHRQDAPRMENFSKTVYVCGPCIAFGTSAPFGETIEARLQEYFLSQGLRWRVVNCGSAGTIDVVFDDLNIFHMMMDQPMREGDIILHFSQYCWERPDQFQLKHFITSSDVFDHEAQRGKGYWMDGCSAHMDKAGYAVWAEYLYHYLMNDPSLAKEAEHVPAAVVSPYASRLGAQMAGEPELRRYLQLLSQHRHDVRGAIVMNANPFTLGHLHLVEYARTQVDFLYIFVVEEDRSEIPFADRFEMVRRNCAQMPDVDVLPSGNYIISALTFSAYFEKDQRQEEVISPVRDVKLFGEAIAPMLGITKRFVGEEPLDNVTRQYNETMKEILPDYGVEVVEIPRKKAADGRTINATQVRTWIRAHAFAECKPFLPPATMAYLREHPDIISMDARK